jgi:hypothetical protein
MSQTNPTVTCLLKEAVNQLFNKIQFNYTFLSSYFVGSLISAHETILYATQKSWMVVTGNIITLGILVRHVQFMMKKRRPISTMLFEKLVNVPVLIEEAIPTLVEQTRQFGDFSFITPWPESARELYRPSDSHLSAKLVPHFADRGRHIVSVTTPYGHILGSLYRSRYFLFKLAPQMYSQG